MMHSNSTSKYEILDSSNADSKKLEQYIIAHLFQTGVVWSDFNENSEKCKLLIVRQEGNQNITGIVGISRLRPIPLVQFSLSPEILSRIIGQLDLPKHFIGFGCDTSLLELLKPLYPALQVQFELFFTYNPSDKDPLQNSAHLHLSDPDDATELSIEILKPAEYYKYFIFLGKPTDKYSNDPRLENTYVLKIRNEIIGRIAIESIIGNQIFIQTPRISSKYRGQGLCAHFLTSVVPMLQEKYISIHVMTFEQDDRAVTCIKKSGFKNVARLATLDTSGMFINNQRNKIQK